MSTLLEVAALATELTVIFNDLGITQQQYAVRTNYDKSYVSRFLNGRRVATQEFIDRLLLEVEKQRQAPVTGETRERLKQLRANALRVYDPELYKLELLRHEVDKSQREVKRLLLHQDALEGLLERRQTEADELRKELMQIQSDWISDRVQSEAKMLALQGERHRALDERNELLQEIGRLREELKITIDQRDLVERRCAALEEQVNSTEIAVVQNRERNGIDDVSDPIEALQARLAVASESEIFRELAEAALNRSCVEIANLYVWLRNGLNPEYATQLASDYCRQRSVDLISQLVLEVEGLPDSRRQDGALATAIMRVVSRRPLDDLLAMCRILREGRRPGPSRRQIISLRNLTYTWLTHGAGGTGRYRHLLEIVDYLNELEGRDASVSLIRRLAMTVSKRDYYAEIISQSGRQAEAQIYASSWLHRMKDQATTHQFVARMKEMYDSAPLVAEAVLAGLPLMFDAEEIGYIFLVLADTKQELRGSFTARLMEVLAENGYNEQVRDRVLGLYGSREVSAEVPPAVAELLVSLDASKTNGRTSLSADG